MVVIRLILKVIAVFFALLILIGVVNAMIVFGSAKSACTDVQPTPAIASSTPDANDLSEIPDYLREEQITFLTFPEWYIVYSAREYSAFLRAGGTPSTFPYNTATAQFWCSYIPIRTFTLAHYPPDIWEHVALITIGSSFSAENLIQETYELTIGNISLLGGGADTPEDQVERDVAADYAQFLDTIPWYRYPFISAIAKVWRTPAVGPHMSRKWERRFALTIGYGVKGAYGWLMDKATNDTGVYAPADLVILLTVKTPLSQKFAADTRIKIIKDLGNGRSVIEVPRYKAFTGLMQEFADTNVTILDISDNANILVSAFAPVDWKYDLQGSLFFSQPTATDATHKRIAFVIPTAKLLETIRAMEKEHIDLEHIYDY